MPDAAPDHEHFCQLPALDQRGSRDRGRSYQCPDCHAEWMTVKRDSDNQIIWLMRVSAEAAAKQVEDLMHELAHEDIDPAVIRAYVQCASHAVKHIVNTVGERHGEAAAIVLRQGWNAFVRSVQPYFLDRPCEHHTFMEAHNAPSPQDG